MAASRAIAINVGQPAAFRMQRAARPLHRPAMPQYMPATPVPRPAGHPQAVRAQAMRAPAVRPPMAWLPTAIFILKLIASGLAGATITLALWPSDRAPVDLAIAPTRIDTARPPRRISRKAKSTAARRNLRSRSFATARGRPRC